MGILKVGNYENRVFKQFLQPSPGPDFGGTVGTDKGGILLRGNGRHASGTDRPGLPQGGKAISAAPCRRKKTGLTADPGGRCGHCRLGTGMAGAKQDQNRKAAVPIRRASFAKWIRATESDPAVDPVALAQSKEYAGLSALCQRLYRRRLWKIRTFSKKILQMGIFSRVPGTECAEAVFRKEYERNPLGGAVPGTEASGTGVAGSPETEAGGVRLSLAVYRHRSTGTVTKENGEGMGFERSGAFWGSQKPGAGPFSHGKGGDFPLHQ